MEKFRHYFDELPVHLPTDGRRSLGTVIREKGESLSPSMAEKKFIESIITLSHLAGGWMNAVLLKRSGKWPLLVVVAASC